MSQQAPSQEAELLFETGKRFYLEPRQSDEGRMAAAYFERAALLGFAPAQRVLGIMLIEGDRVDRNPAEAVKWLQAACDQGDPQAAFRLALMSAQGDGSPKDWARAYELLLRPGVDALPEARELRRRLRSELLALYPGLIKILSKREAVYRASLNRDQSRKVFQFFDPTGDNGDPEEFKTWLALNLGRLTDDEALKRLAGFLDRYYRQKAAGQFANDEGPACP